MTETRKEKLAVEKLNRLLAKTDAGWTMKHVQHQHPAGHRGQHSIEMHMPCMVKCWDNVLQVIDAYDYPWHGQHFRRIYGPLRGLSSCSLDELLVRLDLRLACEM